MQVRTFGSSKAVCSKAGRSWVAHTTTRPCSGTCDSSAVRRTSSMVENLRMTCTGPKISSLQRQGCYARLVSATGVVEQGTGAVLAHSLLGAVQCKHAQHETNHS